MKFRDLLDGVTWDDSKRADAQTAYDDASYTSICFRSQNERIAVCTPAFLSLMVHCGEHFPTLAFMSCRALMWSLKGESLRASLTTMRVTAALWEIPTLEADWASRLLTYLFYSLPLPCWNCIFSKRVIFHFWKPQFGVSDCVTTWFTYENRKYDGNCNGVGLYHRKLLLRYTTPLHYVYCRILPLHYVYYCTLLGEKYMFHTLSNL